MMGGLWCEWISKMPDKTIEFRHHTGRTLTLELFAYGSDTLINTGGDAATEATNRKGIYSAAVSEAITNGWHTAHIKEDGEVKAVWDVYLTESLGIYRAHDRPQRVESVTSVVMTIANVDIDPPAAVGLTTGFALCLGIDGLPEVGVTIKAELTDGPGTAGYALDKGTITMTSDGDGIAQHDGFVRGAYYKFKRGNESWWKGPYLAPDTDTWALNEIVGKP